jgi:hypothetical protein
MNNVVKFIDYSKRKVNYRQQLQLQLLYRRDAEDAEDNMEDRLRCATSVDLLLKSRSGCLGAAQTAFQMRVASRAEVPKRIRLVAHRSSPPRPFPASSASLR